MDPRREPACLRALGDPATDAHRSLAGASFDRAAGDQHRRPGPRRAVGVSEARAPGRGARHRAGRRQGQDRHGGLEHDRRLPRGRGRCVGRTEVVAAVRVHRTRRDRRHAAPGARRRVRGRVPDRRLPRKRPAPPRYAQRLRHADRPPAGRAHVRARPHMGRPRVDPRRRPGAASRQGDHDGRGCPDRRRGGGRRDRRLEPWRPTARFGPRADHGAPEIVEAVEGRVPVLVDGGFRRNGSSRRSPWALPPCS